MSHQASGGMVERSAEDRDVGRGVAGGKDELGRRLDRVRAVSSSDAVGPVGRRGRRGGGRRAEFGVPRPSGSSRLRSTREIVSSGAGGWPGGGRLSALARSAAAASIISSLSAAEAKTMSAGVCRDRPPRRPRWAAHRLGRARKCIASRPSARVAGLDDGGAGQSDCADGDDDQHGRTVGKPATCQRTVSWRCRRPMTAPTSVAVARRPRLGTR